MAVAHHTQTEESRRLCDVQTEFLQAMDSQLLQLLD